MYSIIDSYLRRFELDLIDAYDKKYPNAQQKPQDFRGGYKKEEFIEKLELAFGREIKFTRRSPPDHLYDEVCGDISVYNFEYLSDLGELNAKQKLIRRFYDLAIPYATKFEYEEHPIMYRDVIGIEKTIALLEEANGRIIYLVCNVPEEQENILAENLKFVFLEDDEWYDDETGKVRTDDNYLE